MKFIIQSTSFLEYDGKENESKYGQSINDLYIDLWKTDLRFQHRHKPNIVYIKSNNKNLASFIACNFGDFPEQKPLEYFKTNYEYIFKPSNITLGAQKLNDLYSSGYISALEIDHFYKRTYEIRYYGEHGSMLFILNMEETKDLIDFWNLRAIHQHIVAIPIQWIKELSSFYKDFILKNYRPIHEEHKELMESTVMFSRSIPKKQISQIYKNYIQVDGKCVVQTWYPPIWRKPLKSTIRKTRPTLIADRKQIERTVDVNSSTVQFIPLSPKFAETYGNRYRWANVLELRDRNDKAQIATTFPCNYKKNLSIKLNQRGKEPFLSTTEGLVIFSVHKNFSETLTLMDGGTAITQWFQSNKGIHNAEFSYAGKIASQIIQTLDVSGRNHITNKDIICFLDKVSEKQLKATHFSDFKSTVKKATQNNRRWEILVKNNVVELGMKIKCKKCSSWNWYSLKKLDYSLTCDLCLKPFAFPVTQPAESEYSKWAYRVVGPFALINYAQGGYSVTLSICFFTDIIGKNYHTGVTYSSGQKLKLISKKEIEIDFILWFQRRGIIHYPTDIVFGEAKSFGKDAFKQDDIHNMQSLAEIFPGAILVFTTMRDEISEEEQKMIKELAEWGREYNKEKKQTRAPVIILTGTELFTRYSLDKTWKEKGGKYEQLSKRVMIRIDNLRLLADYTQQLYLDMPSYDDWLTEKLQNKQ